MTALQEINQVYSCALECEIWDQPVHHAAARVFVLAATRFLRALGEAQDSEVWRKPASVLRRCRRLACTVPLPSGHPVLRFGESAHTLATAAARLEGIAVSGHIEGLLDATASLQCFVEEDADPLGDCARDFLSLDEPHDSIVILADRVFTSVVATSMAENNVSVHVGTHAEMAGRRIYSSAVVVGSPTWIRPGLLNAPRAKNLALVHHDVFREAPEVLALLPHPAVSAQVTRAVKRSEPFRSGLSQAPGQEAVDSKQQAGSDSLLFAEECTPAEEIRASFPQCSSDNQRRSVRDQAEAHAAVLADGSHVLLPTDPAARILVLRMDDPVGIRVEQVSASTVGPGDYLALRHRSHHQDLMDRADAILGPDAARLRAVQAEWKEMLWRRTEEHPRGLRGVAAELRSRGAVTANVGYWVGSWCIRPRSKDDFAVVLRYLAAGADVDQVWEQLRRVDSAHRSAGQRYADDLQRALTDASLELLSSAGWCTASPTGSDSPTLIARIDDVLPGTMNVPLHALCRHRTTEDY
ncbi:hypothetical protein AMK26_00760 [Streptomyces sp. CB03234]|uniref:hypothetical protein n=1 Tax=Streptomyces sp. (strain CB03234) TaxID=1703937 RepID=UPI00093CFB7E|nr:hypothetical protein [Streptomyces sp. CB03234]OKK07660.1 hypothetical protein AMK26_00760 [Streptomyces sp. CB03234]